MLWRFLDASLSHPPPRLEDGAVIASLGSLVRSLDEAADIQRIQALLGAVEDGPRQYAKDLEGLIATFGRYHSYYEQELAILAGLGHPHVSRWEKAPPLVRYGLSSRRRAPPSGAPPRR